MPGMKFNLRQKIFLHFLVFLLVNSAIWVFIYYSNLTVNRKLIVIEKKKELLDLVLEARRYEKNFLLRKSIADLQQAISYVGKTHEKQAVIETDFAELLDDPVSVKKRTRTIEDYKRTLENLLAVFIAHEESGRDPEKDEEVSRLEESVTLLGRILTTDIEEIEKREKERVFNLLTRSRNYMIAALASLFLLSILTAFFLVRNVNRPLKSIEKSIQRIVSGDFHKIPRLPTGDEFETLADSLNEMIEELGRRKDQLVQAEKMSSLGILTSGVAHELNNPLNNISTSIQIIREELEDPDVVFKRNLLLEVESQIDRARDIIRALLEFSRQSEFLTEPVVFKNLVDSTMHLISGEIPSHIRVGVEVSDGLEGRMDPRRIQQVLLNLIINSVHAMPDGGKLDISAFREEDAGMFVFQVADTGSGIPKEHLARIFDPFFTTREVSKGSGLGLSISHGIIEQHGGTIQVDSTPGRGTTFTVRLPDGTGSEETS